jgi:hydroxypyruvate reductase
MTDHGGTIDALIEAALAAVEPTAAVLRHVALTGERLRVGDERIDLARVRRIRVLGAGKPVVPMAAALARLLGDRLTDGLVITKHGHGEGRDGCGPIEVVEAGHPLPDEPGVAAARRLADLAADLDEHDLLLAPIAGGGSALLTLPAPGLTLADLRATTDLLLRAGASIEQLNAVRKHLSAIKGGQLARLAAPARVAALVLSDVIGDPLDGIASGPLAPDPTTFADAWAVIEQFALAGRLPEPVRELLERGVAGAIEDTPAPGAALFDRVTHQLVGNNPQAAQAVAAAASDLGFATRVEEAPLLGEAREAGVWAANEAKRLAAAPVAERPACLVRGGETTVTVTGNGAGGRNQELALAAAIALEGVADVAVVTLATDGQDGPTDAAGAIATGATLSRAAELGLDPRAHLARNDSHRFFGPLGDLIETGPTLTNVADILIILAF